MLAEHTPGIPVADRLPFLPLLAPGHLEDGAARIVLYPLWEGVEVNRPVEHQPRPRRAELASRPVARDRIGDPHPERRLDIYLRVFRIPVLHVRSSLSYKKIITWIDGRIYGFSKKVSQASGGMLSAIANKSRR